MLYKTQKTSKKNRNYLSVKFLLVYLAITLLILFILYFIKVLIISFSQLGKTENFYCPIDKNIKNQEELTVEEHNPNPLIKRNNSFSELNSKKEGKNFSQLGETEEFTANIYEHIKNQKQLTVEIDILQEKDVERIQESLSKVFQNKKIEFFCEEKCYIEIPVPYKCKNETENDYLPHTPDGNVFAYDNCIITENEKTIYVSMYLWSSINKILNLYNVTINNMSGDHTGSHRKMFNKQLKQIKKIYEILKQIKQKKDVNVLKGISESK